MAHSKTQPILAGNWKMHGDQAFVSGFLEQIAACDAPEASTLLLIPFPYLHQAQKQLKQSRIRYGAQNVSAQPNGAFTGEVSISMLEDLGCSHVLIGHSERREHAAENDALVAQKVQAAWQSALTPIVCMGESLADRTAGKTFEKLKKQLHAIVSLDADWSTVPLILAYEPIWAIGTGKTASSEDVEAVHTWIKSELSLTNQTLANRIKILYGGSVKPENATALLDTPNVGGLLVGGASLDVKVFKQLVEQCKPYY